MLKPLLVIAMTLAAASVHAQVIYRYQDRAGNTVFSDKPPPRGVPYTVQGTPQPSNVPALPPGASALPSSPNPTVPLPTQALPSAAVPGGPALPNAPVDPAARRDRDAFVPADERRQEQDAVRQFTAPNEQRLDREATRQFVPQGEAARDRRDMQIGVPQGEAARDRQDMQIGVPADELRRERESMRLNQ